MPSICLSTDSRGRCLLPSQPRVGRCGQTRADRAPLLNWGRQSGRALRCNGGVAAFGGTTRRPRTSGKKSWKGPGLSGVNLGLDPARGP